MEIDEALKYFRREEMKGRIDQYIRFLADVKIHFKRTENLLGTPFTVTIHMIDEIIGFLQDMKEKEEL